MTPLQTAAHTLSLQLTPLSFAPPISHIYNPLNYAWATHAEYLERYGEGRKRIIFLGMNPGPFGMVQTGIPFGEVAAVRDFLHIEDEFCKKIAYVPQEQQNPARPLEGFACQRSEVSGRRLWALFAQRFKAAEAFFAEHFVANYCPLAFFSQGRNITPDKLPAAEQAPLLAACDQHLLKLLRITQAEWLIGVGAWAEQRAYLALKNQTKSSELNIKLGRILHPSPASPAANRGWAEAATQQLMNLGVWR